MAEGALFIGWGTPIPGRETAALEVFAEASEFYDGLRKKGTITGVEPVLLSHIGAPIEGFFLLRGEPEKLAVLTTQDAFIKLSTKAALVCKTIMIAPAHVGTSVTKTLDMFRSEINTLALTHQHV
jgi:hypothetical protein